MEVGKGFLQLQEDYSRRSSLHPTFNGDTSAYTTRLGCCGCCSVKVERDEGSVRIGRLSLAPYCHLALLVFGFCFLLAGAVLTGLSYSPNQDIRRDPVVTTQLKNERSQEERFAGPLFIVVGLGLIALGIGLAVLCCKLEKAAARQRSGLGRFSFESGSRNTDIFANLDDIRSQGGDSQRRGSFFGSSFNFPRRSTLSTIAQAVPLGFFMTESPRTPKTPTTPNPNQFKATGASTANNATTKLSDEFQEIELGSPVRDDDFSLPALTLRPSIIPIPMFISPNRLSVVLGQDHEMQSKSRSDEPFGSIVSLGGGRGSCDIASFPAPRINANNNNSAVAHINGLPPIHVMENGNALTASPKQVANKPTLRASRSEDHTTTTIGDPLNVNDSSGEPQWRPRSGS